MRTLKKLLFLFLLNLGALLATAGIYLYASSEPLPKTQQNEERANALVDKMWAALDAQAWFAAKGAPNWIRSET